MSMSAKEHLHYLDYLYYLHYLCHLYYLYLRKAQACPKHLSMSAKEHGSKEGQGGADC